MSRDLSSPAIKIIDDDIVRDNIVDLYKTKTHNQVNIWSIKIVEAVVDIIDFSRSETELINEGITICIRWRNGFVRSHDIRQIGFKIHALARIENNNIKKVAFRTIGQAISSAHMKEHAIVASDYHIKLINLFYKNDFEEVRSTRKMQIEWLENS